MSNDYYEISGTPEPYSWKNAEQITQEFAAIEAGFEKLPDLAEIKQGRSGYATNDGTGNAYEIAVSPAIPSYVVGQRFGVLAQEINTGPATLNVNGLGPRVIARTDGVAVASGDLGPIFEVVYDGTLFLLTIPARNSTGLRRDLNLSDLTSTTAARTNLGLGTLATKGAAALSSGDVTGILPVAKGGTGGTTPETARAALGIGALGAAASVDLAGQTTGVLPVARGGTGGTTAAEIRAAAGLGALATAAAADLAGNTTTGTLPVAKGGTGATTGAQALTNLGAGALASKGSVNLGTADATGILPILKGGTGTNHVGGIQAALGLQSAAYRTTETFLIFSGVGTVTTYAMLKPTFSTALGAGTLVAGTSLRYSDAANADGAVVGFGTWRLHGESGPARASLWQRIA